MRLGFLSMAVLLSILGLNSAHSATVGINSDNSSVATTSSLTGFATTGAMMDGMRVTARFLDGRSETLLWADTGLSSGGVSGSLFRLNLDGDTFTADWNLQNLTGSALTELSIDAGAGNTVFDILPDLDGPNSTPGSAQGRAFEDRSPAVLGNITVTYTLAVALSGFSPTGDLFARLLADFTGLNGGGVLDAYTFGQDTDSLLLAGDLNPVPLPGALPLFASALGLGGLFGYRKRKAAVAA